MIGFLFSYIFFVTLCQVWAQWPAAQTRRHSYYPQRGSSPRVDLKIYYESQCPACKQEVTQDVMRVANELGDRVNIELIPYGKCRTRSANDGTLVFEAQHGPAEVYGNKLHNCIIDMLDPKTSLLLISRIMNQGSNDASIDQCAPMFGINGAAIKQRAKSIQGSLLLKAAGDRTPHLLHVPFKTINGVPYSGNVYEGVRRALAGHRQ